MAPYTQQQPLRALEASPEWEAAPQTERNAQAGLSAPQQAEESARSVMHPDHRDPDWRYYFGAMAG